MLRGQGLGFEELGEAVKKSPKMLCWNSGAKGSLITEESKAQPEVVTSLLYWAGSSAIRKWNEHSLSDKSKGNLTLVTCLMTPENLDCSAWRSDSELHAYTHA